MPSRFRVSASPRDRRSVQAPMRQQDEEMRPGADIFEDDTLKIAAGDALKVEERVIAVLFQVLEKQPAPRGYWCAGS